LRHFNFYHIFNASFEYIEQIIISLKEEVALMREMVIVQLEKAKHAFFDNDFDLAREIISREKRVDILELKIDGVDAIYRNSFSVLTKYLQSNTNLIGNGLKIYLLIYRLERIGDYCSNIVEDIIYYIDAKALKLSG